MSIQDDIIRNQMLQHSSQGNDSDLFGGLLRGTRGLLDNVQGFWDKMITTVSGIWGNGREKIGGFFMNLHAQLKQISDSSHLVSPPQNQSMTHEPHHNFSPEIPTHGLPDHGAGAPIGGSRNWTSSVGH